MTKTPQTMTPEQLRPVFVSPAEAAKLLGLSRSEVYRLLDSGVIDSRRHGSRRLVVVASLHAYAWKLPAS